MRSGLVEATAEQLDINDFAHFYKQAALKVSKLAAARSTANDLPNVTENCWSHST